jgi:hypothetical protein
MEVSKIKKQERFLRLVKGRESTYNCTQLYAVEEKPFFREALFILFFRKPRIENRVAKKPNILVLSRFRRLVIALGMLKSKAFVKRSKRGGIVNVVREHYLRDDIPCGFAGCSTCVQVTPVLSPTAKRLTVIDTNIALHNMDVLAHPLVTDIVVPSTVYEEVKSNASHIATQLRRFTSDPAKRFYVFSNEHHQDTYVEREAGETPNDRNDRGTKSFCHSPFLNSLACSHPCGRALVRRTSQRRHACRAAVQRRRLPCACSARGHHGDADP